MTETEQELTAQDWINWWWWLRFLWFLFKILLDLQSLFSRYEKIFLFKLSMTYSSLVKCTFVNQNETFYFYLINPEFGNSLVLFLMAIWLVICMSPVKVCSLWNRAQLKILAMLILNSDINSGINSDMTRQA